MRFFVWVWAVAAAAVMAVPPLSPPASASDDHAAIMLVLDASGSMRGRIEGQTKMSIAKETVEDVLAGFPPANRIGLMAYGHRRTGDCGDIETIVAPAQAMAPSVVEAVNAMRPRGKTPLTDAVRRAADGLRFQSDPATVIVVTDGVESCGGDPCALARELEADGIEFTAHVVGFGLSDDQGAAVSCVADNTGGMYMAAEDAEGLRTALLKAVEPPKPQATAIASDDFDGRELGESWEVLSPDPESYIVEDGVLLTATSGAASLTNNEPNNVFRWNEELPRGDFDLAVDFTSEFDQAMRASMEIAIHDSRDDLVSAHLLRDGSSNNVLYLQVKKVIDGDVTRERVRVATGACCPRRFNMDEVLANVENKGGRLILQRRGRKFAARLELNGWTPNEKAPSTFTTDELLVLRPKGKPALHAGTWGGHYGRVGQTITYFDRIEITTFE